MLLVLIMRMYPFLSKCSIISLLRELLPDILSGDGMGESFQGVHEGNVFVQKAWLRNIVMVCVCIDRTGACMSAFS